MSSGEPPAYLNLPVINGHVTRDQYENLPYNTSLQSCSALDCMALKSLVRSFRHLIRIYFPNTMARTAPPPKEHGPVPIVSDVALHPEFRKPACRFHATFARDYFNWTVGLLTIELASLISGANRDCLSATLSSLPQNTETRRLVEYARELCVVRHEPNCSVISFK